MADAQHVAFGQIVRERRRALGLTQSELAGRVACAGGERPYQRSSRHRTDQAGFFLGISPADGYRTLLTEQGFASRSRTACGGEIHVLPLTPEELEQAIVGPAGRVGAAGEPGLLAAIVQDVGDQPGMLPLLQYALTELFEQREGRTMTLAAYRESGGVAGALGRRAEELYTGLDDGGQEAARQLFLRLAGEANQLILEEDNPEVAALLALQSLRLEYTPQGDAALEGAIQFNYPRRAYPGNSGFVTDAAFSPDGRFLVATTTVGRLLLWDVATAQQVRQLDGHAGFVTSVAFSPDGKTIATASWDATARLWDAASGQELRRFTASSPILNLDYSPDGRVVAASSQDGAFGLWYTDIQSTADYLCDQMLRDLTDKEREQYGVGEGATCPLVMGER